MELYGKFTTTENNLVGQLSPTDLQLSGALSNSTLRGYSAYEIAVQHGFVGDEGEWLESLKAPARTATDSQAGIVKMYDEPGNNIDGTMTQRSITRTIQNNAPQSISTDDLIEILQ